jgi:hypothetical protein
MEREWRPALEGSTSEVSRAEVHNDENRVA